MPLKITCQVDGFWRGGQKHFRAEKIWPDDAFTKEQREQLLAEPKLHVVEVKAEKQKPVILKPPYTKEQLDKVKWDDLTKMLGDQYKPGMNKEEVTAKLLEMKEATS